MAPSSAVFLLQLATEGSYGPAASVSERLRRTLGTAAQQILIQDAVGCLSNLTHQGNPSELYIRIPVRELNDSDPAFQPSDRTMNWGHRR